MQWRRVAGFGVGRPGRGLAWVVGAALVCLLAASASAVAQNGTPSAATNAPSIEITSPIGRIGMPSRVRIVAQIRLPANTTIQPVRFLVDGREVGIDGDGPPYGVDWTDVNPFEACEIAVEVTDAAGAVTRAVRALEPFELVEATQVTSVLVDAGVYDEKGHFARGLQAFSFDVKEDGAEQAIDLVRVETVPATFALLVDSSQSMWRRIDFVRVAATRLLSFVRPVDRVMVVPFTQTLGTIVGPTNDQRTVTDAIGAIQAKGGTAVLDALAEVADRMATFEGRKAIVLVTDGYDENSKTPLATVLEKLKKASVTVYCVGIGGVAGISLRGEKVLRQIGDVTGGRTFFPPRAEELEAVYDTLAADAQHRYLITYTPSNQKSDGRWRAIAVNTRTPGYVVRAREGYFAPPPAPIRPVFEFTVMDLESRYLDVTRDDLVVIEDEVEQTIETFHEAVTPISMVLVLDSSGSMKKAAPDVMAAARQFVGALRPQDRLSVMTFADKIEVAHALGTTREWSHEAIDKYQALGGTALYDAIYGAVEIVRGIEGRRAIVLLSDGRDEDNPGTGPGSVRRYADALRAVRDVEVVMFPVGLGSKVDREKLEELAQVSAGHAYFPQDVSALAENYARILENLSRRYVVSYTSTNPERNGGYREVRIQTRSGQGKVAARPGYYAPEK